MLSGRTRYVRRFMKFEVQERIQQTWLSRTLPASQPLAPTQWVDVDTYIDGRRVVGDSRFAGMCYQILSGEFLFQEYSFTPSAKRAVVTNVLMLWKDRRLVDRASNYIDRVSDVADDLKWRVKRPVDVSDLPSLPH